MLVIIGTLYFFYILLNLYIHASEMSFVAKTRYKSAVILSEENYQSAADYKIANEKFSIILNFYDYALFLMWILFGLNALESVVITDGGVFESAVFVLSFLAANFVLTLPFDIYATFVKDRKFGFSTINAKTYMLDIVKSAVIFVIAGGIVAALVSWIISSFVLWWFWSYAAVFIVILVVNVLYPTLIAPMFNKFIPLEDGELKIRIEALMTKSGFKSSGVFTVDASKRDNRLNAYFGGIGKSKRVVLFDTLLKKLNNNELLAVLGHELGHFKHKDIIKNMIAVALFLFVAFAIFGNLPQSVYEAFGLASGAHSVIVIFLLLSSLVGFLAMPLFGFFSRKNEYRADKYGSECESKEALSSALMKLADENKSFPYSHPIFITFHYTHPPLVERLKALGADIDKR